MDSTTPHGPSTAFARRDISRKQRITSLSRHSHTSDRLDAKLHCTQILCGASKLPHCCGMSVGERLDYSLGGALATQLRQRVMTIVSKTPTWLA